MENPNNIIVFYLIRTESIWHINNLSNVRVFTVRLAKVCSCSFFSLFESYVYVMCWLRKQATNLLEQQHWMSHGAARTMFRLMSMYSPVWSGHHRVCVADIDASNDQRRSRLRRLTSCCCKMLSRPHTPNEFGYSMARLCLSHLSF